MNNKIIKKSEYVRPELELIQALSESDLLTASNPEPGVGDEDSNSKGGLGNGYFSWGNLWKDEDVAEDEYLD